MKAKGKVALITGGARIGRAIADALARTGCHIVMTYRASKKSAKETVSRAKRRGVRGLAIAADASDVSYGDRLVREIEREFGRLDILVNMASVYEKTPLNRLDEKQWRRNLDVNLRSAYVLSLAAASGMRRRGEGRIIHFSDWIAASGRPRYKDYIPYYVAKSAVVGLTEALALELAPEILVNAVAPGPILAPEELSKAESDAVLKSTPLRRWGGPDEIAKAVLFLIESDFVTGETIRVDGGRHLF